MSLLLKDIVLTYPDGDGRLTAVDHADLDVPAGTVTALVGPSGSGKSSLLAVAAALVTPDSGEVVVNGTSLTGLSRARLTTLRRQKIGIVFQQPNLLGSLTAAEQLAAMAHLDGRSTRTAHRRAADLLDAVGLADRAHYRPHQLSGGQRQRVNIARALMNDPAVLLVDEPTSALDRQRGAAIIDLLSSLTTDAAPRPSWSPTTWPTSTASTPSPKSTTAASPPAPRPWEREQASGHRVDSGCDDFATARPGSRS